MRKLKNLTILSVLLCALCLCAACERDEPAIGTDAPNETTEATAEATTETAAETTGGIITETTDLSGKWLGEEFTNPSNIYRARKLLYNFTSSFDDTFKELIKNGYGGVVSNVKFDSEYLKKEGQFRLVDDSFTAAQALGLRTWIYDEYQWPSGKAFGQVLEGHPELEATGIELLRTTGKGDIEYALPDGYICIVGASLKTDAGLSTLKILSDKVSEKCDGEWTLYIYARRYTSTTEEKPNDFTTLRSVDLLNPDSVARFLELTYQKYRDNLPNSFDGVDAFFTDEPQLGNRDMVSYVVWTDALPDRFQRDYGYSITENLYSLFYGDTDFDKIVRINFYQTVSDMFREAYTEQIESWCSAHGVSSSGHLLFEEAITLQIETYGGDFMQIVGAMDIPGGDILHVEADNLMDTSTNIGNFMGLKYVSSAAKNAGKTDVMLEFSPYAITTAPFAEDPGKHSIAGATLATFFGANRITVICPDDIFTRDALVAFNTYIGRINAVLDTAHTVNECAVFVPVNSVRAEYNAVRSHSSYTGKDAASKINYVTTEFSKTLVTSGVDFTLIDEQSIISGSVSGGKIKIGPGEYSVVVMPSVSAISLEAMEKLCEFSRSGGNLIWLESTPSITDKDGEQDALQALVSSLGSIKKYAYDSADAAAAVKAALTFDIKATLVDRDTLGGTIFLSEYYRADGGKQIFFLANSSTTKTVELSFADGRTFDIYAPYSGKVTTCVGGCKYTLLSNQGVLIVCEGNDE